MGSIADYYRSGEIEEMGRLHAIQLLDRQKSEDIIEKYSMGIAEWETKEGEDIMVTEMTVDHVKNCLNFLKNQKDKSNTIEAWIKIFKAECKKRKI